tara:strand:+ start:10140 stop:10274 length:135 start_codon:yes stop_codon:yes gene_type:complete
MHTAKCDGAISSNEHIVCAYEYNTDVFSPAAFINPSPPPREFHP